MMTQGIKSEREPRPPAAQGTETLRGGVAPSAGDQGPTQDTLSAAREEAPQHILGAARGAPRDGLLSLAGGDIKALAPFDTPIPARKRKLDGFTEHQWQTLYASLAAKNDAQCNAVLQALQTDRNDPAIKVPFLLEGRDGQGGLRRYVMGPMAGKGHFGKFRVVLELHDGTLHAAKEYRGAERFDQDGQKVLQKRQQLFDAGVLNAQDLRELSFDAQALKSTDAQSFLNDDQAHSIETDPSRLLPMVQRGELAARVGDRLRNNRNKINQLFRAQKIDARQVRQLQLKTAYTAADELHNEYALAWDAGSPLTSRAMLQANGRTYVLTELMDGEAVNVAAQKLSPSERRACTRDFLCQLARGMSKAHKRGVIHRDLKLQNVLFDSQAQWIAADWGSAARLDSAGRTTGLYGTPPNIAPEMTRKQAYGAAVDVYCLGLSAVTLAMGRHPFAGGDLQQVALRRQAFPSLYEALPLDAHGLPDMRHLLQRQVTGHINKAWLQSQPPAQQHLRQYFAHWYKADPTTAQFVFQRMLAPDPKARPSMQEVSVFFTDAAPAGSMERLQTLLALGNTARQNNYKDRYGPLLAAFAEAFGAAS